MSDTAPTCFWLVGHGFTCAPVWNEAYNSGGWNLEDISQLGYIVPIGEQKYQTTVYLSNTHEWESFEIEIYSDLQWNNEWRRFRSRLLSSDFRRLAGSRQRNFAHRTIE